MGLRDKINMLQLRVLSKLLLSEIEMERELVLCQSQGGENGERGTEMLGLFEALPTLQSSPCDYCL